MNLKDNHSSGTPLIDAIKVLSAVNCAFASALRAAFIVFRYFSIAAVCSHVHIMAIIIKIEITNDTNIISSIMTCISILLSFSTFTPRRICRATALISVSEARRGCARPPPRHHAEPHTPKALPASGCCGRLSLVVQGSFSISPHVMLFHFVPHKIHVDLLWGLPLQLYPTTLFSVFHNGSLIMQHGTYGGALVQINTTTNPLFAH